VSQGDRNALPLQHGRGIGLWANRMKNPAGHAGHCTAPVMWEGLPQCIDQKAKRAEALVGVAKRKGIATTRAVDQVTGYF